MFYETIDDITADAGVRVRAKTLEELICKVLLATFNEITDISCISINEEYIIEVGSVLPFMLADIINQALAVHEKYNFIARECEVLYLDKERLKVKLKGGKFDPEVNEPKLLIKAATYHRLNIEHKEGVYEAEVVFDI